MNVNIVDTTLRDGEQKAGIALGINDKVDVACLLDKMGIYQIEAGIPAMLGTEKEAIKRIVKKKLKSKIATWNRINESDIIHSIDCNPDIIHISVPSSDIQIETKLDKDRSWVIEKLIKCIELASKNKFEVTIGLEDASRADFKFIIELIKTSYSMGVKRVRYADTVGILHSTRIYNEVEKIINYAKVDVEIHAHNDFGMAVSNSVTAAYAGAKYIDCTIGGIGERSGNCDYISFIKAMNIDQTKINELKKIQYKILNILNIKN